MPDMTPSGSIRPGDREPADDRRSATRRDETPPPYEPPHPEPPTHDTALPGEASRAPGDARESRARETTEDPGPTTTSSDTPLPATPGPTSTDGTNSTTESTGATAGPHDDRSTSPLLQDKSSLLRDKSSLLPDEECDRIAGRMRHAVVGFVDGPRDAVAEADEVLEELAGHLMEAVDRRRRTLRGTWRQEGGAGGTKAGGGKDRGPAAATAVDTEQLRLALRDYRELTERLLRL
jgi:hypothetical protein